jgi:serine/threonine protein kinase
MLTSTPSLPRSSVGTKSGSVDDPRVVEAVQAYLAALESGNPPDRGEFLSRYLDLAEVLSGCLDALDMVHACVPQLGGPDFLLDGTPECATGSPECAAGSPECAAGSPECATGSASAGRALGDFRLIREIGRGGMGIVYEAEQLSLGRRVALKVLPLAAMLDAKQLARFKNEAQAAAQLQHPHIVGIHFVGCERGVHFYAMQLIEGRSLAAVIDELRGVAGVESASPQMAATLTSHPRPLIPADDTVRAAARTTHRSITTRAYFRIVAELGIQAAEALQHAHDLGIIHRDIKPSNILVNDAGHLWITDFGLARIGADANMTMTGDLLGTLRYMSPEQATGKPTLIDHRTDVYSLGATLYELLCLRPAFDAEDRQTVLHQVINTDPTPPRRHNSAIPTELETIILKSLQKTSTDRYETAQDLADDLRRFLDERPIHAKRTSVLKKCSKWSRRHKPLVASLLLVLSVLLAMSIGLRFQHTSKAGQIGQSVRELLAAVRAAIEAKDLALAQRRLVEAEGRMAGYERSLPDAAVEAIDLRTELDGRVAELNRFRRFVELNDMLVYDEVIIEATGQDNRRIGVSEARQVLGLYHILDRDDWSDALDQSWLHLDERQQVRRTAYNLLLHLV